MKKSTEKSMLTMNRFFKFRKVVVVLLCLLASTNTSLRAQILTFNFNAGGSLTSNFNSPNVMPSTISHTTATLSQNTVPPNGYTVGSWVSAATINTSEYFEFTITPVLNGSFSVSTIVVNFSRTVNGPRTFAIRNSLNNYASTISTVTVNNNGTVAQQLTLIVNQASINVPVTYRIYGYNGAGNNSGRGGFSGNGDDIVVNGIANSSNFLGSAQVNRLGRETICSGDSSSLGFVISGGVAPFVVQTIDNDGDIRTFTGVRNLVPVPVYPVETKTYSIYSVSDSNGQTLLSQNFSGSALVNVNGAPVVKNVGTFMRNHQHNDGQKLIYSNPNLCESWVKIDDELDGANPGSTTTLAQVFPNVVSNGTSRHFVPRRVNIQPANNVGAKVVLFFSQQEFNNYNSTAQYNQKLPANSTDTVGVLNKLLVRRTNNSIETDSLLNTYTPTNVVWNAQNEQWEVSINVPPGQLRGNYYVSTHFNTQKMVSSISHVANLPVMGSTSASVMINWDSVAGVNQYRLRFRQAGGNWNAMTVTGRRRLMNNLAFNTTYEAQVRVFESNLGPAVQGEYTRTYTFTTPQEPNKLASCVPPPTTVDVNSPMSATINWVNVIEGVTYFVQLRAKNTLTWGGTSTSGTTLSFNSLVPNTTYEYRIRTTCTPGMTLNGTSDFSPIDTFRTPALSNCGEVLNVNASSVSTNSAVITWTPVAYATSYMVQSRIKNSGSWGGTSTTATSFTINGLNSGTDYEFRVRATCNPNLTLTGIGGFSSVGEFTTNSTDPLATCLPPSNIQAIPSSNNIVLTWDGMANDTLYFIQNKLAVATAWGGGSTANTTRTLNNLQPNTEYHVRIRTTCKPGTTVNSISAFSDTILVVTTPLANKFALESADATSIRVYPNPTRDWLHIDYTSETEEKVQVIVRDMTGRIISTTSVNPMIGANPIDVNLQQATEGLYLVQVFQGNAMKFMNKIQKQ